MSTNSSSIQGVFRSPAIGTVYRPFPITDEGEVFISEKGLQVSGDQAGGADLGVFGCLTLVILIITISMTVISFNLDPMSTKLMITSAIALIMIGAFSINRRKRRKEPERLNLELSWDQIRTIKVNPYVTTGEFLIVLQNYKPKGAIHFTPSIPPEEFLKIIAPYQK